MCTVSSLEFLTEIVGQQLVAKLMQHSLLQQFGEKLQVWHMSSFLNCLRQGQKFKQTPTTTTTKTKATRNTLFISPIHCVRVQKHPENTSTTLKMSQACEHQTSGPHMDGQSWGRLARGTARRQQSTNRRSLQGRSGSRSSWRTLERWFVCSLHLSLDAGLSLGRYAQTHARTHMHTCTHVRTHTRTYARTHTHVRTHTHTHARAHACMHTRTHAHKLARTHTRTHTHTHTHTQPTEK